MYLNMALERPALHSTPLLILLIKYSSISIRKILLMLNIYKYRKSHDFPYQCPKGEILPSVLTIEESVSLKLQQRFITV